LADVLDAFIDLMDHLIQFTGGYIDEFKKLLFFCFIVHWRGSPPSKALVNEPTDCTQKGLVLV
jgi:hypothetical protein